MDPGKRTIIAIPPVGYPRDGIASVRYATYDEDREELTFVRLPAPTLDL